MTALLDDNGNGKGNVVPAEGATYAHGGYNTEGDIVPRVTATADNVDLNVIWQEMAQALGEWNRHRTAIVDQLTCDLLPQKAELFGDDFA
jgi:hypothetical protein